MEHTERKQNLPRNPVFAKRKRFERAQYDNRPTNLKYFRSFGWQIMRFTPDERPSLHFYITSVPVFK